jgi:hypothetical protein
MTAASSNKWPTNVVPYDAGECLFLLSEILPLINQCCVLLIANCHINILVKLQRGIMTAASSNKWPTNVVPYVLENAFFAI